MRIRKLWSQHTVYQQFIRLSKAVVTKERSNSSKSRGHRLDHFLKASEQAIIEPAKQITNLERINAIRGMMRVYDQGFVTEDNLLKVISDIVKGE